VCLPCVARRAIDGDTIEVSLVGSERRYAIRLIDCWCPEMREPGGPAAKAEAEHALGQARDLALFIPLPADMLHPLNFLTFERIPGHLFLNPYTTLSEWLVRKGFATAKKTPKGNPP
jgi:endonuclease YncB( thermonuclease family)